MIKSNQQYAVTNDSNDPVSFHRSMFAAYKAAKKINGLVYNRKIKMVIPFYTIEEQARMEGDKLQTISLLINRSRI